MIENIIVMGYGQIGEGVYKINKDAGFNVEIYDPFLDPPMLPDYSKFNRKLDLIEICIPFNNAKDFESDITKFLLFELLSNKMDIKNKKLIINIRSTIRLGFALLLQDKWNDVIIIHSPVRATHPRIYEGIKENMNFYGFADKYLDEQFGSKIKTEYFDKLGIKTYKTKSSEESCLGKHNNTLWYGLQIAYADEMKQVCENRGISFEESYTIPMRTDKIGLVYSYNEKDRASANQFTSRPTMVPGALGGHCIIPNLEIIKMDLTPELVKWIQKMDIKFRK